MMQDRKDKYLAALLAFFGGIFGLHRFYLKQNGLGILMIGITLVSLGILSTLISVIDAIVFLSMDTDKFDRKYNAFLYDHQENKYTYKSYGRDRRIDKEEYDQRLNANRGFSASGRKNQKIKRPRKRKKEIISEIKQHRESGIENFRSYDFEESIRDFHRVLDLDPYDVAAHFNIACAYSQIEKPVKAMQHISQAVQAGFDDFNKIKGHEKLAFARIQPEWESFEKNGFVFEGINSENQVPVGDEVHIKAKSEEKGMYIKEEEKENLLEHLKRLKDLRENGLISDVEFELERRKLMSS